MGANCHICGCEMKNRKNRYCRFCAAGVVRKMRESGYLQDTYVPRYFSDERGRKGMRDMRAVGGAPY